MKTTLIGLFVGVFALAFVALPAFAAKGDPAATPKATGSIEAMVDGGYHLYADFNGHMATDKKLAKGTYHVWGMVGSSSLDWYGKITEVTVTDGTATLHGVGVSGVDETGSSVEGKHFTLYMTDGGSPAEGNDTFMSGWGDTALFPWSIVGGNLVVHK